MVLPGGSEKDAVGRRMRVAGRGGGRGLFCLVSSGGGDRAEPSGNDKSTTLLAPEGALNNWSPPPLAPDWGEEAEDVHSDAPWAFAGGCWLEGWKSWVYALIPTS